MQSIKEREQELLDLVVKFCNEKLDHEYLMLCQKLVVKMGRKRDVPFKRGKLEIWASAVIYAIGSINFLSLILIQKIYLIILEQNI